MLTSYLFVGLLKFYIVHDHKNIGKIYSVSYKSFPPKNNYLIGTFLILEFYNVCSQFLSPMYLLLKLKYYSHTVQDLT
jgi:hypothetical protein